jgi:transcription antitermination factor NusG
VARASAAHARVSQFPRAWIAIGLIKSLTIQNQAADRGLVTTRRSGPVPTRTRAPCGSNPGIVSEFSSKSGWGGSRSNSGGPRANSGGVRAGAGRKPSAADIIPPDDSLHWYCVRTCHDAELTADIEIRQAGFTLFSPSLWKPAQPARRDFNGAMRAAKPDRIEPLFKRYLFVRFCLTAHDWQEIRHLPGVDGIMGLLPERPTAVPDAAIDLIRGMCAPNDCVYPDNVDLRDRRAPMVRAVPMAAGSSARLLGGPMADLPAFANGRTASGCGCCWRYSAGR